MIINSMDNFVESNSVETIITRMKNYLCQSLLRFIDVKDNFAEGIIIKSDFKLYDLKWDTIKLVAFKTINLFLDIVNR